MPIRGRLTSDDESDPVERTRRQLRCYYDCVSRDDDETFDDLIADGTLCDECGKCEEHCGCSGTDPYEGPRY